jgi:perosamine synthetase
VFEKAFKIADSGRQPGTFWIESLGKKMKMSNPTAALALAQLQSVERQIARKRMIRDWYVEELQGLDGVTFQGEGVETRSICWMTSVHIGRAGFGRDAFREALLQSGIDTRPVFSPMSRYPVWERRVDEQPVAAAVSDNAINLPSGVRLSRGTVTRVGEVVRKLLR